MKILYALLTGVALAQPPAGTTEVTADDCKLYLPPADAKGASRIRWSGQCKDGLAAGKITSAGESYFIRGGHAIRSRGGDPLESAASELPTWALELSMVVEDRAARAPAKPAATKVLGKPAEEQKVAQAQKQAEAATSTSRWRSPT